MKTAEIRSNPDDLNQTTRSRAARISSASGLCWTPAAKPWAASPPHAASVLAGKTQPAVHALYRYGRPRHRHQCREDPSHRPEGQTRRFIAATPASPAACAKSPLSSSSPAVPRRSSKRPSRACCPRPSSAARWPPSSRSTRAPSIRTRRSSRSRWKSALKTIRGCQGFSPQLAVETELSRILTAETLRIEELKEHYGRSGSVLRHGTAQVRDRARVPPPRQRASSRSTASTSTSTSSPPQQRAAAKQPLGITDINETFDVVTTVKGGGVIGQADAVKMGIARALIEFNIELRKTLKADGLSPATHASRNVRSTARRVHAHASSSASASRAGLVFAEPLQALRAACRSAGSDKLTHRSWQQMRR